MPKIKRTYTFPREEIIVMIERKHNIKLDPERVTFGKLGVTAEVDE